MSSRIRPEAGPNQAQNIRHGTHKPAHDDSERFWPDFGAFRRRSEPFNLRETGVCKIKATGPYEFTGFGGIDVTKPYEIIGFGDICAPKPCEFIGFGAMDVTKPYEFTGLGAMYVTKPYEFIGFGAMDVTKPYEFIGFGAMDGPSWLQTGARPSPGPGVC